MPKLLSDYFNATELCRPYNKFVADYIRLSTTKAYLTSVSIEKSIPISELIIVYKGGNAEQRQQQGTWIHSQILDHFTYWLKKSKVLSREKEIQDTLCSYLKGARIEVNCPVGKIDILTSNEIIEVKLVNNWITGVGQLIIYGYYYPTHTKRLHLFGGISSRLRNAIEKHCKQLSISVTYED